MISVKWPPETFILRTIRTLDARGIRLQLGISTAPGQRIAPLHGIDTIRMQSWDVPWLYRITEFSRHSLAAVRHPRRMVRLLKAWMKAVRERKEPARRGVELLYRMLPFVGADADVVHFQWNNGAILYAPLLPFFDCPVVISCRGSQINVEPKNPRNAAYVEGLRKSFAEADAVHCVSEAMCREAQSFGADPTKIWVIRPAIDPEAFSATRTSVPPSGVLRIVSVGRLVWQKGYEYALLALRRLLDLGVNAEIALVGDGPDRQRLEYTIHDLNLQRHARLLGQRSTEGVRDSLEEADVFLLSSVTEGISNAVLEAMASGLPIVTTDCGGMREAVAHGVEGLVVPVRDTREMALALKVVAEDAALRMEMGRAARRKVETAFSLQQQGEQFERLYKFASRQA